MTISKSAVMSAAFDMSITTHSLCAEMAFNKLVDERESRLFGYDIIPEHQLRDLSLYVEYLEP